MQNSTRRYSWRCDFCSRASKDMIRETFSYRCEDCDFDLCFDCVQPRQHPGHAHALDVADTAYIYSNWFCDICGCENRPDEILSRHCKVCKFDACRVCFHRHITTLHQHPLFRADSHFVYPHTNGGWRCNNCKSSHHDPADNWPWHCHECHYDLCDSCIGATPGVKKDAEDDVRKLVSPDILSGLQLLEDFVQILSGTPKEVSAIAAQRIMPELLGLVKRSHEAFCHAESTINQINDRLDNDLQNVVVEEKHTNDNITQTQASLDKLAKKVKVLEDEYYELEQQLSKLDLNLRRENESLRQRRKQLEKAKGEREKGVKIGSILGGIFGGPLGYWAGGGIAQAVHNTDVSNAEEAVNEASSQVASTKRGFAETKEELSDLIHEHDEQEIVKRWRCQELELLKTRKEDIKESQKRLGKLNESIKNCAMFVDTTTSRAKMMADEAKGELPDIEAMVFPLKAIAGDLAEASLSNSRLLSGRVDIKEIGTKIKAITSKALKGITSTDVDQWA
ncbi:hypothetical protein ACROYT_G035482 [Oculina patagonica]